MKKKGVLFTGIAVVVLCVILIFCLTNSSGDKNGALEKDKASVEKEGPKEDGAQESPNPDGLPALADAQTEQGTYDELLEAVVADTLYYEIQKDGSTMAVVGYDDIGQEEIIIPEQVSYEGKMYPVTAIKEGALSYAVTAKKLQIAETITSIGKEAFCGCEALESVTVPDTVTSLGTGVFYDCKMLKSCKLGAGIQVIPDETFTNCYELQAVQFSENLVSVGNEVFWSCESLRELSFPKSTVSLGNRVFYTCGLKRLYLPSPSIALNEGILDGADELKEITVDSTQKDSFEAMAEEYGIECKVKVAAD